MKKFRQWINASNFVRFMVQLVYWTIFLLNVNTINFFNSKIKIIQESFYVYISIIENNLYVIIIKYYNY